MKKIAVIPAVLALAGMLAGCGGPVTYATMEGPEETLGVNVWPGVEEIYTKGDFSAFPKKDDEKEPAKRPGKKKKKKKKGVEPATAWQRRLQSATKNLLDAVTEARRVGKGAAIKSASKKGKPQKDRIREGKLSYDEVSELEPPARRIQLRARELARTVEGRARERRIAAELAELRPALRAARPVEEPQPPVEGLDPGQGEGSQEDEEFARLGPVAERIEVTSTYFWRATAIHSKMDIGDSWTALLTACRGLPGAEALTEPLPEPEPEPGKEGEAEGEGETETAKKGEADGESEADGTGEVGTGPEPVEETGPGTETESSQEPPAGTSPAGEL